MVVFKSVADERNHSLGTLGKGFAGRWPASAGSLWAHHKVAAGFPVRAVV